MMSKLYSYLVKGFAFYIFVYNIYANCFKNAWSYW